jgi:polar amino acid transport system substrate-binding protein
VVGDQFTEENYGIGVPKDNEDMVRYVNAVLDKIRGSDAWQNSYRRWVEPSLGPASPPSPKYK